MRLNVDDAHPSSSEHLIDGVSAGPVQVALILPVLHKPERTATHTTRLQTHITQTNKHLEHEQWEEGRPPVVTHHVLKQLLGDEVVLSPCLLPCSDWTSGVCRNRATANEQPACRYITPMMRDKLDCKLWSNIDVSWSEPTSCADRKFKATYSKSIWLIISVLSVRRSKTLFTGKSQHLLEGLL